MDNLFAIGVGLGLRALIDTVTHHNHRVNGSLVGLWEGAVLRHFIAKYPSSLDPYIAYGFRLLVDILWTSSWMRLVIVVLWTFMGMLLSDVGVDLAADRRFRRLMRSVRHTVIYPLLRQFSRSRSSSSSSTTAPRAQFYQIPASASTTSTVRSPPLQPRSPTDVSGPARGGAATPGLPRRPALRVPGSFSDRTSETDTDAPPSMSRDPSITSPREESVTSISRSSSSRTPSVTFSEPLVAQMQPAPRHSSRSTSRPPPVVPLPGGTPVSPGVYTYTTGPPRSILSPPILSPPPLPGPLPPPVVPEFPPPQRPRTPSELEYVAIPAIPDNIEQINPTRPIPRLPSDDERSVGSSLGGKDRSGLTTPTSDTERPRFGALYSPEPVNSGLTTPERPPFGLPPVKVLDEAGHTPSVASRDLSDVNPIPIPIRVHERPEDDAEQVQAYLHPELLPNINTPQPSPGLVPPAQYLPSPVDEKRPMQMPEPQPAVPISSDVGTSRLSMSAPPPPYEHTPGTVPEDDENTPAGSVISNLGDRQRLLQRAESFRSIADESEKRRQQLKRDWQDAKRNREYWAAFRLKHEMDRAEKETKELHAKAARRFYQGMLIHYFYHRRSFNHLCFHSAQHEARTSDH